jgi:chromosome segregation ATPase
MNDYRKRFSAEISEEIRQVKLSISNIEEIRERELIEIKGQMGTDRKRQDEASVGIQQVNENRERIDKNKSSIVEVSNELANLNLNVQQVHTRVEKEAEETQTRQRERDAKFEHRIKQDQSKVAEELKIEKEMVSLKQDLKTQIEVRESGTSMLAQQSDKDGLQTEPVNTQLQEMMQLGMSKGVEGLGSGEFPLPIFNENASVNPVSQLRQLEEFFKYRGVQQKHWLTVAK